MSLAANGQTGHDLAEYDSGSSASGSLASSDLYVPEDPNYTLDPESNFDDALNKLDELTLEPDTVMPGLDESQIETGSIGTASTGSRDSESQKDATKSKSKSKAKGVTVISDKNDDDAKPPKRTNKKESMFERLKRLTRFEKKPKGTLKSNYSKFRGVKVDRLPAFFVAKYLGHKEVDGLFGLEHVREPVDDFVDKIKDDLVSMDKVELPLCYVVFSSKGIDIREHSANRVKNGSTFGLHPIDFISYGVQDIKYWRVFTFIAVYELSSRKKRAECHAFIADSSQNARRMALALGACFQVYKRKLNAEGKFHNFQVELRPPDELTGELNEDEA